MRGGRRKGTGRKNKADHLKRNLSTIRLPQWMILQIKDKGELGYVIDDQLANNGFFDIPYDYDIGS